MADANKYGTFKLTVPAIMTFPKLFKAEPFKRNGVATSAPPRFSANFLLDPNGPDLAALRDIAKVAARAETQADFTTLRFPFSNGDKLADKRKEKAGKDDAAFNRGKVVLAASTGEKYPPLLAVFPDHDVSHGALDLGDDEELIKKYTGWFYSGVLVLAKVNLRYYPAVNEEAKAGVKAYLASVVSLGIGDRLTGGASPSQDFGAYTGHVTSEDPTVGMEPDADDITY